MADPRLDGFESLALVHLDGVFRMARRLAGNDAEAEDLAQETFLRAYRAWERFELRDHGVKPWLFKILHNAFYTVRGKARRQPALLGDVDFDRFAGSETASNSEHGVGNIDWDSIDEELKSAVDQLHPEYREVLLLWAFEDLSYKEIAEICDCPTGTVMSRLYRARRMLDSMLVDFVRDSNVPKKG